MCMCVLEYLTCLRWKITLQDTGLKTTPEFWLIHSSCSVCH